ncbi:MAPEG family protein [Aestuariibacter salexigens]|uniref:MAPEG family protein n=1 Tax=Aestuariibacter salexigens TaxID=226010 RepID=UPI00041B1D18|nr:MAPEG family protein [Aestuariibacter salexigens]
MNATILALAGYIGWTLLLLLALATYRSVMAISGQHKGLRFQADGFDVPELGYRLTRAQANCVESFSFIGGLMLMAMALDVTAITDPLALWLLAARVGQSIVHIVSISNAAIQLRFLLFLVQFLICAYWTIMLIMRFI